MIDFIVEQRQKFESIINKVQQNPEVYLAFDTVADVYQAQWIKELPAMCTWYVSGLDDGAEDFYLRINFQQDYVILTPYQKG